MTPNDIKTIQQEQIGIDETHTRSVLDRGYVRLIDWMGSDLAIVRSARVSHSADWRAGKDVGSDARLIDYLWKHGHVSPFESVEVQFEVKAPIFVLRQWHRHRTQSYNEVSARYTELPSEWYVPDPKVLGVPHPTNKQQRVVGDDLTPEDLEAARESCVMIDVACSRSFSKYEELLARGVPRELARSVLPVATYSRMFAKANLNNWFRFLRERLSPGAQREIKAYAVAILDMLAEIAPNAVAAFRASIGLEQPS